MSGRTHAHRSGCEPAVSHPLRPPHRSTSPPNTTGSSLHLEPACPALPLSTDPTTPPGPLRSSTDGCERTEGCRRSLWHCAPETGPHTADPRLDLAEPPCPPRPTRTTAA